MTPSWDAWIKHGQHFGRHGVLKTQCVYCAHIPRYPITRFGTVKWENGKWTPYGWEFDTSCRDLYPWTLGDLLEACRLQTKFRSLVPIDPGHRNAG